MPVHVWSQPQGSQIANMVIGAPASAVALARWGNDLAYLHCKQVQIIGSQLIPVGVASGSIRFAYCRSPGVSVARVDMRANRGTAYGARFTMAVSVSAGTITWIDGQYFDGVTEVPANNGAVFVRSVPTFVGFFDVRGITAGTTVEIIFTWTNVANSTGPRFLQFLEVCQADTSPVADPSLTGEMGVDGSWTLPGNPIFDGTATTKSGLIRVVSQLDRARKDIHRHFHISTPEDATTAWVVVANAAADIPFPVNNDDFAIRVRPRLLYIPSGSGPNANLTAIRYKCSGGGITGHVYFKVTPVGGATTTTTVNLPNSTVWATATPAALSLPTTGANQECDVAFQADTSAGSIQLGLLGGIEAEL